VLTQYKVGQYFTGKAACYGGNASDISKYIKNYIEAKPAAFRELANKMFSKLSVLPESETRLGIEVECEDIAGKFQNYGNAIWPFKSDGSLRQGGLEFVSLPLPVPVVRSAIALLLTEIYSRTDNPGFSWRTSTHAHLECRNLSLEELRILILLHFLFEEKLFTFAHSGRRDTNIFCTPISRSFFYGLSDVANAKTTDQFMLGFQYLKTNWHKYSSLNINHLYDFGTLEFRHMRGCGDPEKLGTWIKLLITLYNSAHQISLEELTESVYKLNTTSSYRSFTERVFGEELSEVLEVPSSRVQMSRGVSLLKEILAGKALSEKVMCGENSGLHAFVTLKEVQSKRDRLQRKRVI